MNNKKSQCYKKIGPYQLLREIGAGSFARVYRSHCETDNQDYAIKMISKNILSEENRQMIDQEIQILLDLNHPNIIKLHDFKKTQHNWYLVFEFCELGDLEHYMKKYYKGRFPEKDAQKIIHQISLAFVEMHKRKIVHRDLKLANILVNKDFQVKMADFGFAKYANEQSYFQSYCGTPITMGPEILKREKYNEKCDIWSLGVIIYQMLYGEPPFNPKKGGTITDLLKMIDGGKLEFPVLQNNPGEPPISECVKDLIRRALVADPDKRMNFEQFFLHPWININAKLAEDKNEKDEVSNLLQSVFTQLSPHVEPVDDNAIININNGLDQQQSEQKFKISDEIKDEKLDKNFSEQDQQQQQMQKQEFILPEIQSKVSSNAVSEIKVQQNQEQEQQAQSQLPDQTIKFGIKLQQIDTQPQIDQQKTSIEQQLEQNKQSNQQSQEQQPQQDNIQNQTTAKVQTDSDITNRPNNNQINQQQKLQKQVYNNELSNDLSKLICIQIFKSLENFTSYVFLIQTMIDKIEKNIGREFILQLITLISKKLIKAIQCKIEVQLNDYQLQQKLIAQNQNLQNKIQLSFEFPQQQKKNYIIFIKNLLQKYQNIEFTQEMENCSTDGLIYKNFLQYTNNIMFKELTDLPEEVLQQYDLCLELLKYFKKNQSFQNLFQITVKPQQYQNYNFDQINYEQVQQGLTDFLGNYGNQENYCTTPNLNYSGLSQTLQIINNSSLQDNIELLSNKDLDYLENTVSKRIDEMKLKMDLQLQLNQL